MQSTNVWHLASGLYQFIGVAFRVYNFVSNLLGFEVSLTFHHKLHTGNIIKNTNVTNDISNNATNMSIMRSCTDMMDSTSTWCVLVKRRCNWSCVSGNGATRQISQVGVRLHVHWIIVIKSPVEPQMGVARAGTNCAHAKHLTVKPKCVVCVAASTRLSPRTLCKEMPVHLDVSRAIIPARYVSCVCQHPRKFVHFRRRFFFYKLYSVVGHWNVSKDYLNVFAVFTQRSWFSMSTAAKLSIVLGLNWI